MTSRVLGLVREQVMAAFFGASHDVTMDAYNVAFRIPNLLRDLFAEGAMSAAFVPTFTAYLTTRGKGEAWRVGNNVLNALIIVTGVLVLLGIVFADPLIRLLAAESYTDNPEKLLLTVKLARIMLPALVFIALAAALMGMLNSLHHYFVPALSPAMFNVMTIVAAFVLVPMLRPFGIEPITTMAIGTVLGGVAQLALQWPTLRREGFRFRPGVDWQDPGLRRVLVLMGPGSIGMAATQINILVNTQLATGQGQGAASWLNYAFRLMYLPIGLFGVSIATATLPAVSRHLTGKDVAAARETVTRGISLMLMLNVPATVGLVVLGVPIVRLIFERGAFNNFDTMATAAALQFYAVGLVGYSVVRIASPIFYALGRSRVPVIVSAIAVLSNAVLNINLVRTMGYTGLALGTSIAALINATILFVLLRRALGGLNEWHLLGALARIGIASAVMAIVAIFAERWLSTALPRQTILWQVIRVVLEIGAAVAALAAAAWILRIKEFHESVQMIVRRFQRRT
jgi:putative peptidoglycan lipid II flippase